VLEQWKYTWVMFNLNQMGWEPRGLSVGFLDSAVRSPEAVVL